MSLQLFTNNAISLLQVAISSSATEIQLQPGLGSLFPQPSAAGEFFLVTLETVDPPFVREIVKVTGRVGDTLTGCARGQEGTTPRNWDSMSTLVDHRITAETMRQAFLQPISSGGTTWINGENSLAVPAPAGTATAVNQAGYSSSNRTFKFLVTVCNPLNGNTQSFELLATVQGLVGSSTETVSYTKYGRIGSSFAGDVGVQINTTARTITLLWDNTSAQAVELYVTRIQHSIS